MYEIDQTWVLVNYPIIDSETNKEEEKETDYSVYDFFISFIKRIIEF